MNVRSVYIYMYVRYTANVFFLLKFYTGTFCKMLAAQMCAQVHVGIFCMVQLFFSFSWIPSSYAFSPFIWFFFSFHNAAFLLFVWVCMFFNIDDSFIIIMNIICKSLQQSFALLCLFACFSFGALFLFICFHCFGFWCFLHWSSGCLIMDSRSNPIQV